MESDCTFLQKMNSALKGEKITLGFIGGSITQGTGASAHENCYAYRVFKWWQDNFDKSETVYVNAGIGGTDSKFGAARAEEDLLSHKPDVVIIEFAVNDVDNPDCLETAEGLIRKILKYNKDTAVLLLCNLIYDRVATMQEEYSKLAIHYGLPLISIKDTVYREIEKGNILQAEVTADNIHPLDFGHGLIACEIIKYLEEIKKHTADYKGAVREEIPLALTSNSYENVVRYNNVNSEPDCNGFISDSEEQTDIRDCFKKGWFADKKKSRIEFELETRGITVQYRRTVAGPAPKVEIYIDGEFVRLIDGRFDEDWGDKLELVTLADYEKKEAHRVTLEVTEADEGCVPFYLVSIISKL